MVIEYFLVLDIFLYDYVNIFKFVGFLRYVSKLDVDYYLGRGVFFYVDRV